VPWEAEANSNEPRIGMKGNSIAVRGNNLRVRSKKPEKGQGEEDPYPKEPKKRNCQVGKIWDKMRSGEGPRWLKRG